MAPQDPTPTPTPATTSTASTETPTGTPPQRPSDLHNPNNPNYHDSTLSTGGEIGLIIGVIILLLLIAFIGYFLYTRLRARRLGVSAPSLNPFADSNRIDNRSGGFVGWVKEKFASAQRGRQAGGAYEGTGFGMPGGGGGAGAGAGGGRWRNGRGGLDPDEAWDARVGNEAEYDEQELGDLSHSGGGRGGGGGSGAGPLRTGMGMGAGEDTSYASASRRGDPRVMHHDDEEEDENDRRYSYEQGDDLNMIDGHQNRSGRAGVRNPFEDPDAAGRRGISPMPMPIDTAARGKRPMGGDVDSPTEKKSVFKEVV